MALPLAPICRGHPGAGLNRTLERWPVVLLEHRRMRLSPLGALYRLPVPTMRGAPSEQSCRMEKPSVAVKIWLLREGCPTSHTAAIRPSGLGVMVSVQGKALGTWHLQCLFLLLYVGHRLSESKTGLVCLPGDPVRPCWVCLAITVVTLRILILMFYYFSLCEGRDFGLFLHGSMPCS